MKIRNCFLAFVLLSVTIINNPLFAEDWLPDPNLRMTVRAALREEIGLPDDTPLVKEHLRLLTHLEVPEGSEVNDLTGLEYAVFLGRFNADHNQIEGLQPLASLVNLRSISLHNNRISDITPLANLTNLEDLYLSANRISDISPLEKLTNLKVLHFHFGGNQISNLLPLADLVELEQLALSENRISDISPLEKLPNLKVLHLGINQISDITPLINLTELVELSLNDNQIVDVTPLENLSNLVAVSLQGNPIRDLSPLLNLPALRYLNIEGILVENITPFLDLNLIEFKYDVPWICSNLKLSTVPPVEERISNRTFPSVFQISPIWIEGTTFSERVENSELVSYHDIVLSLHSYHNLIEDFVTKDRPFVPDAEPDIHLHIPKVEALHEYYHSKNPNFVQLFWWDFFVGNVTTDEFPDEPKYWLLDTEGNKIRYAGSSSKFYINFLNPVIQDYIIAGVAAISECGLFDGLMVDNFSRDGKGIVDSGITAASEEEIHGALIHIFSEIRARVRDDFIIIVNIGSQPNSRLYSFTELMNGSFMEYVREVGQPYDLVYLMQIEDKLRWNEENLRPPHVNCVEGFGLETEHPNGLNNQKWMRVITTLTLTHSDGYVLYNRGQFYIPDTGHHHDHYWYDFWDTPLGRPIGGPKTKAQLYDNRDGVFIREYTNGWAVYNRSGKEQEISLPIQTIGVESGITSFKHIVPDLDGEIYLKTKVNADVNDDGVVNILDLVVVANAFGEAEPDLNGDGVVNIQDLVIVANAF